MAQRDTIYLIPGFFGFVNFGQMVYFAHVREFLEGAFDRLGLPVTIHRVRTSPTASIRRRASELLDYVASTAPPRGRIHLVGHSTGGLDARLFATPGVSLAGEAPVEPLAARVRTVVSVATPHAGTPLASFFTGLLGQRLLQLLSIGTVTVLRRGHLPLWFLTRLGALFARLRLAARRGRDASPVRQVETVVDQLIAELLGEMGASQRQELATFFRQVSADTALLPQLGPEGIDLFNAAAADRPGVRYGAVVTRARPPGLNGRWTIGRNVYAQVTYNLYEALYRLSARMPAHRFPAPLPAQQAALVQAFGEVPRSTDNDGIVPTLSQVRGDVVHAAWADHLDVVGHFDCRQHLPPHVDWLTTGSGFSRGAFERLWTDVASYIAAAATEPRKRARAATPSA